MGYLDITFNFDNDTVSPFRKNNQYPCHINVGFNHPRQILKHIPNGIMFRLSTNSSSIDVFTQNKHNYEMALKITVTRPNLFKSMDEAVDVLNRRNDRTRKSL